MEVVPGNGKRWTARGIGTDNDTVSFSALECSIYLRLSCITVEQCRSMCNLAIRVPPCCPWYSVAEGKLCFLGVTYIFVERPSFNPSIQFEASV